MIIINYSHINLQEDISSPKKRRIEVQVRNDTHKSYTLNLYAGEHTGQGLSISSGETLLEAMRATGLDIESITRTDEKGKPDDSPEGAPAWQTFSTDGDRNDIHRRNGKIQSGINGTPSYCVFDATNNLVKAFSHCNGEMPALSHKALLAERKRQHQRSDARLEAEARRPVPLEQSPDIRNSSINFLQFMPAYGREILSKILIEKNGKKWDGPHGEPAVTEMVNGRVTSYEHYKKGLLNNGPDGDAAKRVFHDNGHLHYVWYYQNGKIGNGPHGEAGEQCFSPDGQLYRRQYFYPDCGPDGRTLEEFFNQDGTLKQCLSLWKGERSAGLRTVREDFYSEGMRKSMDYLQQGPYPVDGLSRIEFHPNGQPKRVVFAAQERYTVEFHYDDAGKLSQEVQYQYSEDEECTRIVLEATGRKLTENEDKRARENSKELSGPSKAYLPALIAK